MPNDLITFHNGLVTSRDPSTLQDGELQRAQGCEYREGSFHLYKQPGRRSANDNGTFSSVGGAIHAIHRFEYENSTDDVLVLYLSDGTISEVTTFTDAPSAGSETNDVVTGLNTSAVPNFASMRDQWVMCNGNDTNYLREGADVTDASGGSTRWRTLGMVKPAVTLVEGTHPTGATTAIASASGTGDYDNEANAQTTDLTSTTYSSAKLSSAASSTSTWTFTAADLDASTGRKVRIVHGGTTSDADFGPLPDYKKDSLGLTEILAYQKIEIAEDGSTFNLKEINQLPYTKKTTIHNVDDSVADMTNVIVKITTTVVSIGSALLWARGEVYAIMADDDASTGALTITNDLQYGYTERYHDSNGVQHESNISPILTVLAANVTGKFGIAIDGFASSPQNSFTTEYVVYRSLDEEGGGYPFMYEIGTVPKNDDNSTFPTTFIDTGQISFTDVLAQTHIYETLPILYPDGSQLQIEVNGVPPVSKKLVPFQGSMVYVPADAPRVHYSIPATITPAGLEQVPQLYYLEFVTPFSDTVTNAEVCNGGRSMIVYFARYAMLVNYLPQATDPGVFDQRVTELVSNVRGCAGPHAAAQVTLSSGRTFAVAADALGVWATDGVSTIMEWSNEIDWVSEMAGVTLSNMELVDNPEMDRLECLYLDVDKHKEIHFYYGRMKQDIEGNETPLITGPHQASSSTGDGFRCKHYANVSGVWAGWSGDNTSTGDLYVEREQAADDSLAYDGSNTYVPFDVQSKDFYVGGLGRATKVIFGYPKFNTGAAGAVAGDPKAPDESLSPFLWLVADDVGLADGAEVTSWVDRVAARGFNKYTHAGGTNDGPVYKTNRKNGHASCSTGTGVIRNLSYEADEQMTGEFTFFIVYRAGDTGSNFLFGRDRNFGFPAQAGGRGFKGPGAGSSSNASLYFTNTETLITDTFNSGSSKFQISVVRRGLGSTTSEIECWQNLQNQTAATPADDTGTLIIEGLFSIDADSRAGENCDILEFVVYNTAIEDEDLNSVMLHLNDKYDLGYSLATTAATKSLTPGTTDLAGFFGTFRRDGLSTAQTKSKTFVVGGQKKLYWQMYADRHNIRIKDISSTRLDPLVAYEVETIDSGIGRDK